MIRLTAKDEDYLETIYRISKTSDTVGVTEVAKARKVTVPTARTAVARLAKDGLVRQQHYGKIILNPSGKKLGEEIFAVHRVLRQFLTDALLIEPQTRRTGSLPNGTRIVEDHASATEIVSGSDHQLRRW